MTHTTVSNVLRCAAGVFALGFALSNPLPSPAQDLDLTAMTGAPNARELNTVGMAYDSYRGVMRTHYVGYDDHVHELGSSVIQKFGFFRGIQRWDNDLTALTGGPAATTAVAIAFDPNSNTMRTHYISSDQHVHELALSPAGQWQDSDLTAITGAPLTLFGPNYGTSIGAGSIGMAFDPAYHVMRTHYVAIDLHVHELGVNQTGQRWTADLTAMTGAPPVSDSTTIAIAFDPANRTMRTHYVAMQSNGTAHLHELGVNGAAQWWDADLTAISGVPQGGGIPAIAFDPVSMTPRTHYTVAFSTLAPPNDPGVRQLSIVAGRWQDTKLTPQGTVPALKDIAIAFDPSQNTMRTLYISADSNIHELLLVGGQWQHTNLTVSGRLSTALGLAFDPVRNAHVAHYVGLDKHVHELCPIP